MPRALDHLVIASHDLSAQADLFERMGFQVGARNRHPWGTENHIVQFDGAFLELIALGPDFVTPDARSAVYPFAGFLEAYLKTRQGLSMLVMRSADAEADRVVFDERGIGGFARFDFARQGRRPDGEAVNVAFSVAFAASPAWSETGFFVCQQHYPENFWSAAAQIHRNGALGVDALRFEHPSPEAGRDFLSEFLDARAYDDDDGYGLALPGAEVRVRRGGDAPALAGLAVRVADLDACRRALEAGGVAYEERAEALVAPAETTMGVELAFVAA